MGLKKKAKCATMDIRFSLVVNMIRSFLNKRKGGLRGHHSLVDYYIIARVKSFVKETNIFSREVLPKPSIQKTVKLPIFASCSVIVDHNSDIARPKGECE